VVVSRIRVKDKDNRSVIERLTALWALNEC